jgi:hypothetical protein
MFQIIALCVRITSVEFIDKRWAQMQADRNGLKSAAAIKAYEILKRCHDRSFVLRNSNKENVI